MAVENLVAHHALSYDRLLVLFSLVSVFLLVCQVAVASAELCIFYKLLAALRAGFHESLFSSHLPPMFLFALFTAEPEMSMRIVLIIGISHRFLARSAGGMFDHVLDPALT